MEYVIPGSHYTYSETFWRRLWSQPKAIIGFSLILFVLLMAIIGPFMTVHQSEVINLKSANQSPSLNFWFGSDNLGRDLFARVWMGARISLFVGVMAAIVDLLIGVLWGAAAGLFGGLTDEILMRIADLLFSLPYLLIVILLMVVMGSGLFPIIIALSATGWITMARIVRVQVMQLKNQEFVLAAKSLGASTPRLLFRHILPNALGPIIVTVALTIPSAIFIEAYLSFLGLGVQAPAASWGTLASEGLPALRYYPWRLFFPALFISLTLWGFNLLGDAIRDASDPKQNLS